MEMSDECAKPGTICASVISAGSQGMSRFHSWVDLIVCPLGHVMRTGFCVGRTFVTSASSTTKWPVVPESPMARLLLTFMLDVITLCAVCIVGSCLLAIGASWVLGSDHSLHVDAAMAAVECPLGYVTLDVVMVMSSSSTEGKGWGSADR